MQNTSDDMVKSCRLSHTIIICNMKSLPCTKLEKIEFAQKLPGHAQILEGSISWEPIFFRDGSSHHHGVQRGSRSPQRKVGPSKMLRPPKTSAMAGPPNYRPPQRNWIPSSPHHFPCAIFFPDDHSLKFFYHLPITKPLSCCWTSYSPIPISFPLFSIPISSGMKNWKTREMKISGAISCRY